MTMMLWFESLHILTEQLPARMDSGATDSIQNNPHGKRQTHAHTILRSRFDPHRWDRPTCVTRSPGRLDVLGGISDYSGALVLQLPIAGECVKSLKHHGSLFSPEGKSVDSCKSGNLSEPPLTSCCMCMACV